MCASIPVKLRTLLKKKTRVWSDATPPPSGRGLITRDMYPFRYLANTNYGSFYLVNASAANVSIIFPKTIHLRI